MAPQKRSLQPGEGQLRAPGAAQRTKESAPRQAPFFPRVLSLNNLSWILKIYLYRRA
jgi:hypothetical protein